MTVNPTIAVVGLGYVGLPLAVEFGKKFSTIGFDLSAAKVAAYNQGSDPHGRGQPDRPEGRDQLALHYRSRGFARCRFHRGGGADAG